MIPRAPFYLGFYLIELGWVRGGQTLSGAERGVTGIGSADSLMRSRSQAAAAARPSAMAHTIRDWPRPLSPAM